MCDSVSTRTCIAVRVALRVALQCMLHCVLQCLSTLAVAVRAAVPQHFSCPGDAKECRAGIHTHVYCSVWYSTTIDVRADARATFIRDIHSRDIHSRGHPHALLLWCVVQRIL